MTISLLAISVDGSDVPRLARFWADVLDRPVNPGATASSAAIGLRFMFRQVPEGKSRGRTGSIPTWRPATTNSKRTG
jgi:hypothetical protein